MARQRIHVRGTQFVVGPNLVDRPIVMRTSFCLLAHYAHNKRDHAKRWLDRIQAQGFDGPRVFAENTEWHHGNSPFFRHLPQVNAYAGPPNSGMKLVNGYETLLERFVEDLDARGMIAEFTSVATIKERDEPWSSNGLNAMAQQLRELFPAENTPLLHESVNEADAHSKISHEEARRYGSRWRRSAPNDPTHHNYPGSTIGISMGGEWPNLKDHEGCTHMNVHPPRKGGSRNWWEGPDGGSMADWVRSARQKAGKPVYLNETIHYMTQSQWDEWIPQIPKWSGLSTTNAGQIVRYAEEVVSAGGSFCFHDFVGMGTHPGSEITRGEEAFSEWLGGGVVEPPVDPPPSGEPSDEVILRAYGGIVDRAYRDILGRPSGGDPIGRLIHSKALHAGKTEAELREQFMRGPEFRKKNGLP